MNLRARAAPTPRKKSPAGSTARPPAGPRTLDFRGRLITLDRPRVMGILNLTPDSFYDGGRYDQRDRALARAEALAEEGADLIDLGAVSTRPGSTPVSEAEELSRLLPALDAVRRAVNVPLTVDTYRPAVARAAADRGADGLNDVTGLRDSEALAEIAAEHALGLVLMHMRGTPDTMQADTTYADLVQEVCDFLADSVARARAAGVPADRIVLDPGIGFGKSAQGNLILLRRIDALAALGYPVLIGASRKSFIGRALGLEGLGPEARLEGSLAAAVAAVLGGADLLRVHDVRATLRAVRLAALIRDADSGPAGGEPLPSEEV
ncbi:MAG TPA: dihydropteroate synthase [Candidatus Udaeobacter sp.]|nr:dihydropteroate synthase [Candidatus Udaeobacter sp.]